MMGYPKIVIYREKIKNNIEIINKKCHENGISIMGIAKSFCSDPKLVKVFMESGIEMIGDSRLDNLEKLKGLPVEKVLIRIPMISTAKRVIELADISLNSEVKTIEALNREARVQNKKHKIILMIESGDLREGILPEELESFLEKIEGFENIELVGLGTNFSCIGGIIPDREKIETFNLIVEEVESKLGRKLSIVSGGNSSSYHLLGDINFKKINNLRIGEAIVLGQETAFGERIEGCSWDAFVLQGEIVEVKEKQSFPKGKKGVDAFGQKPNFKDRGIRKRAIVALGKQDIDSDTISPKDKKIQVIGASSDHLVLDITESLSKYEVGDIIEFHMEYSSLLRGMASVYIEKEWL